MREQATNTLQNLKSIFAILLLLNFKYNPALDVIIYKKCLFIVELNETTHLNLRKSLKTSHTSPVHPEKSTMFVNTKPVNESNANTLYFIVGFGTILSLLLLTVIVIQLCKKSSKSNREYQDIKTNVHDDTLRDIQQINQQAYNTLSEPTRNNVLYYSVEVYSEIDEDLVRPERNYSNPSEDYEETDLETSSKELPYRSTVLSDRHTKNDSDIHDIYLTPLAS